MEVYGVYFSAENFGNPKPVAVAMKSVCDYGNANKNDVYQSYAAYNSSRVMYEFITTELT